MNKISLNGKWKLKGTSPEGESFDISADVPGSTLNAVLNSDVEKNLDVFYRDNAEKVQKYENYSWIYSKTFEIEDADKKLMLVFERLDTYCDIYINDKHLAFCDNGFIPHKFDITGFVIKGENSINIYFYSPITKVVGKKEKGFCAFATYERIYTRREQCTYGWDWAMRFVTCGIGNVYMEEIDEGMKVDSAYVYTKSIDEDSAEIVIDIDFKDFEYGGIVDINITDPDGNVVAKHSRYNEEAFMRINLDIENPRLWYPIGYGNAELYKMEIKCKDKVLCSESFGIRTVKIMELSDKEGSENYNKCTELKKTPFSEAYDKNESFSGFILKINGKKIMCKGANWVPCEPFAKGNTDKKVTEILELAKNAGVNMIRVWGGGKFETEHFYDECSRLGIMVTQDFLMACALYPEDEKWFLNQLEKEAEYAVDFLRNKACLVWWSGDNENAVRGSDTDTDYRGRASAYKAIAPVLYKKDCNRRFLASSPYGGSLYASNTKGTTHNTQFLGYFFDYIMNENAGNYKDYLKLYSARFIAEEPVLGAASENCLKKFMTAEDIYGDDMSMWLYHTKTNPGLKHQIFEYICNFAQGILGDFKDGEDRFFKLKYLQYEWLRVSLERVRREKWFCSGVIYWMLNDCWPAASGWALIDYYNNPKAGYYAFKRSASDIALSFDMEKDDFFVYLCNDTDKEINKPIKLLLVDIKSGDIKKTEEIQITAFSQSSFRKEVNYMKPDDSEVVFAYCEDNYTFYKNGDLKIAKCETPKITEETADSITLKADKYAHAVCLEGGIFEENYFTMQKGEIRTVKIIQKSESIDVSAYTLE